MKKFFSLSLLIFFLVSGNIHAFSQVPDLYSALWVTRNFKESVVKDKRFKSDRGSVMSILKENAKVETAYGGGFVASINSVSQDKDSSWFYYVNGILGQVGALNYNLKVAYRFYCYYRELFKFRRYFL